MGEWNAGGLSGKMRMRSVEHVLSVRVQTCSSSSVISLQRFLDESLLSPGRTLCMNKRSRWEDWSPFSFDSLWSGENLIWILVEMIKRNTSKILSRGFIISLQSIEKWTFSFCFLKRQLNYLDKTYSRYVQNTQEFTLPDKFLDFGGHNFSQQIINNWRGK